MTDDDPITLAEACHVILGDRVKVSTLRAEAARGNLSVFRLGRRDFTTAHSVRDMVRKCQDAARLRASTSTPDESNGLSETEQASSARAALNQSVQALKGGLPRISGRSTGRGRAQHH